MRTLAAVSPARPCEASNRQHPSAYFSILQHTSAYVSIRTLAVVSRARPYEAKRQRAHHSARAISACLFKKKKLPSALVDRQLRGRAHAQNKNKNNKGITKKKTRQLRGRFVCLKACLEGAACILQALHAHGRRCMRAEGAA
jgi:hypothetical protein